MSVPFGRAFADAEAVLFDYDGTLADTMECHFQAWLEALKAFDRKIERLDFFPFEGMRVADLAKKFLGDGASESEFAKVIQLKDVAFRKRFSHDVYPGVRDILKLTRQFGKKMAVVSGGSTERIRGTTPEDVLEYFSHFVGSESIRNGKPHPEPYLVAAEKLGCRAEHCIVVENAPLGATSAKSAGMLCVGVLTTVDRDQLAHCDFHFRDMQSLAVELSRLSSR